jgi:DNA-directed RNA polymerase subunit L
LKDPRVLFAGYRNPHPLVHKVLLRVQTDSSTTPAEALDSAITDSIAEMSLLEERFRVCFELFYLTCNKILKNFSPTGCFQRET